MRTSNEQAKDLSVGGALLAALAASSCCLGPLLLAGLGVGGAGVASALGAYRPYLLAATAAFLAAGFYFSSRRSRAESGDSCGCDPSRTRTAGRVGLWLAAVVVVLVAAAPPVLARWNASSHGSSGTLPSHLESATFDVAGVDCEACAAPMRAAPAKVGGLRDLRLDVRAQRVTIAYEPAPGRPLAYVNAFDDLGYEAKLLSEGEAK
ncbi:heavy-metal-associated domain-containing protein [Pendulispora rubella]|uniref:Mercuric transport protein MerT n=1 Tax=Pendulispora rubella TaxID=2741070 RepID=A0ABZ2KXV0_9BACT